MRRPQAAADSGHLYLPLVKTDTLETFSEAIVKSQVEPSCGMPSDSVSHLIARIPSKLVIIGYLEGGGTNVPRSQHCGLHKTEPHSVKT